MTSLIRSCNRESLRYTTQLKQSTLNRFYSSGLGKITFSKKYKIDRGTLISWLKDFSQTDTAKSEAFLDQKDQAENIRWTSDKKLWAVLTFVNLEKSAKSEFLPKHGLYSHKVNKWKLEMTKGLDIGFKNLEELKILAKKIKKQEEIIFLQKKLPSFFRKRPKTRGLAKRIHSGSDQSGCPLWSKDQAGLQSNWYLS